MKSQNPNRFLAAIGFFFVISMFLIWAPATYYLFKGSWKTRIIILLLFAYQLTIKEKSEIFRKFLKFFRVPDYFDTVKLILEEELQPNRAIYCCHPHGIIPFGFGSSLFFSELPIQRSIALGTRVVRFLPVSGIIARWVGIFGVDKAQFGKALSEDRNISFVPGGYEEATLTNNKKDILFLKSRKGFIKLALKFGYTIYPTYTFNENKVFYTINGYEKFGLFLNRFKLPGCFVYGDYFVLPRSDAQLYTVIGRAVQMPKIEKPSKKDVSEYHEIYMKKVEELFYKYNKAFGASDHLEIV